MSGKKVRTPEENNNNSGSNPVDKSKCGVIMPIADTEGYPAGHWLDVREIIYEAIRNAGFEPNLVSFDIGVSTIHKTIVQNLYFNDIVVCDISSRNANVMFELGMRLAFDKPTVIIKDDNTPYSFDIAGIEHLNYPHDLRYKNIEKFKENLTGKIKNTISAFNKDPKNFSIFLKHFGDFKVPRIDQKEVGVQEIIIDDIKEMKSLLRQINNRDIETVNNDEFYSNGIRYTEHYDYHAPEGIPYNKLITLQNLMKVDLDLEIISIIRSNNAFILRIKGPFSPAQIHKLKINISQLLDSI
ncbi:hypothetical protein [Morganella morganii]|uniref:hypothetical protein n=1 Tax=Morganella morganii TaxID=582 RepID=UPI002368E803|nr:hypothetical protein [Morganella morganii]